MTDSLTALLLQLSEGSRPALLWGRQGKPYFGPAFDRLLAAGVLVECPPIEDGVRGIGSLYYLAYASTHVEFVEWRGCGDQALTVPFRPPRFGFGSGVGAAKHGSIAASFGYRCFRCGEGLAYDRQRS